LEKKYTILIVEDEVLASTYLSEILNSFGHTDLYIFKNGQDAIDILDTVTIDFAFLDINIQGSMDGIKCAHLINENYDIPIIFTTAYNYSSIMKEASKTNMFGYLIKPFVSHDVEASIFTYESRLKQKEDKKVKISHLELSKGYSYHINSSTLYIDGVSLNLTKKERELLAILVVNIDNNIAYNSIAEEIWGGAKVSNATIRDLIRRLRIKAPALNIQSISSFGYILRKNS